MKILHILLQEAAMSGSADHSFQNATSRLNTQNSKENLLLVQNVATCSKCFKQICLLLQSTKSMTLLWPRPLRLS